MKAMFGIAKGSVFRYAESSMQVGPRWRQVAVATPVLCSSRNYRATSVALEDVVADDATKIKEEALRKKLEAKLMARDYNNRRAAYKRQVSVLRREYADEIIKQRAADEVEEEKRRQKLTRQRLERQRRKNIQSAANALREEELRKQREREFNEHLARQQQIRDAKKERFRLARQMVIDELEKEAPLWITTPEEVEAVFSDPIKEQLLWARPGGVLGAPNPSIDAHFWQYETHTANMERTYVSQRQALLDRVEEMAYYEANIDKNFWTQERMDEQEKLEQKARLRAMVHAAGRTALLQKQRDFIQEDAKHDVIPKASRVPSLNVLNNDDAMEREGAKILLKDPTKFFQFENDTTADGAPTTSSSSYSGPTLGAPVGLRDPLRENYYGTVFPEVVGRYPKPDTRTEREKKLAEREEKMWAAAQAEAQKEIEAAGGLGEDYDEDEDDVEGIDYDEVEANNSDDEEWERGLDPETETEILATPRAFRYSEDDVDWVINKLNDKMKFLNQQFAQDVEIIKEELKMDLRKQAAEASAAPVVTDQQQDSESGSSLATTSPTTDTAIPEGSIESALLALPEQQLLKLSDLDEMYNSPDGTKMADYEFAAAVKEIPGLSEEQILFILNRDRSLE